MRQRAATVAIIALLALGAAPAEVRAQTGAPTAAEPTDPDVEALRPLYEYGRYDDVLARARGRLDRGGLTREQLVTLHKYAALAAFNLGQQPDAERHFTALLRLDPDFSLDPFAVAPPTVAFFEKLKKDLDPQLDLIRQQQRLEAERKKREDEDRVRRQADDEARRRRLEELSRRVTVRNVEQKSFLVNFVPFGAGQFQQGRTANGVVLAAAEGAFALTSIIAYFAYDALIEAQDIEFDDAIRGRVTKRVYGIPLERVNEANTWRIVKYASAGAFYTLYGYGVVDSIYHHQDEVVTTTTLQLPPEPEPRLPSRTSPASPGPAPVPEGDVPVKENPEQEKDTVPLGPGVTGSARLFLYPTPGGMGAGLTLNF